MLRSSVALAILCSVRIAAAERAPDLVDPTYACHKPSPSTQMTVSFKPDVSLAELATWVTGFTCKNVIFSAEVAKHATKLTVIVPGTLTPKQALALFVDAVEATGLVVQQKPDTIIIKLGPNMPKGCPDVAAADAPRSPPEAAPVEDQEMRVALEKGVKKIDATHYEVTGALFEKFLENPMAIVKGARVVPSVANGKPNGFKLYAIRPSSFFAKLGFLNGDTWQKVNGYELDGADRALEIYTKLRDAKLFEIQVLRRGAPVTISIKIKR